MAPQQLIACANHMLAAAPPSNLPVSFTLLVVRAVFTWHRCFLWICTGCASVQDVDVAHMAIQSTERLRMLAP